jgi:hypothetical protein
VVRGHDPTIRNDQPFPTDAPNAIEKLLQLGFYLLTVPRKNKISTLDFSSDQCYQISILHIDAALRHSNRRVTRQD